ncbi:MAG: response regulator [Planctomycetes bacterium]|nr:response regulator [Planctomycetota bacterium]
MPSPPHLLCVEPSRLWRRLIDEVCSDFGIDCRHASGTLAALGCVVADQPVAILAGHEQPDLTATSLIAALRADRTFGSIPIAVLTSSHSQSVGGVYQPDRTILRDTEWLENVGAFLAPIRDAHSPHVLERKPRVLLVEDSATLQRIAARILHVAGYEVTIADHGVQALEILERNQFDLIFMDIEMPEMDGRETIRRIRSSGDTTPVIALTGHEREHFEAEALDLGFDAMCPKPIRRAAMIELSEQHVLVRERASSMSLVERDA